MAELNGLSLLSDGNLVAYYRMENANDSTSNAYNLTNVGTTPFNSAKYGNGADLGSSNTTKCLYRNSAIGITSGESFTVSFWVKLNTEIGSGAYDLLYFDINNSASRFYIIQYQYNGGSRQIQAYGSMGTLTNSITLGTSLWTHIALSVIPAGGATKLYVNGTEVTSGTSNTSTGNSRDYLTLGASDSGLGNPSSCIFDDVAFFDRVLTADEVKQLYSDPSGGILLFL